MTLEFDPHTGFSQQEDKLVELLIPRRNAVKDYNKKHSPVTELVNIPFNDLYADWEKYNLECPPGLVLVPGECAGVGVTTEGVLCRT